MWPAIQHPLRVAGRLTWLAAEMLLAAVAYVCRCAFRAAPELAASRATWLQKSSLRVLRVFGVELELAGAAPCAGLMVCNHLGYLDILVLSALTPCAFVAKSDVKRWPIFGWFARLAGTIFVSRENRLQAASAAGQIEAALRAGLLVVLFPEGTSTGGDTVLPFKSALFEPAVSQSYPLAAAYLSYDLADGVVSEEVCYWKDMTLLPHLVNLLSKRAIRASVRFARPRPGGSNRKELALRMHAEVMNLKNAPERKCTSIAPMFRSSALTAPPGLEFPNTGGG